MLSDCSLIWGYINFIVLILGVAVIQLEILYNNAASIYLYIFRHVSSTLAQGTLFEKNFSNFFFSSSDLQNYGGNNYITTERHIGFSACRLLTGMIPRMEYTF